MAFESFGMILYCMYTKLRINQVTGLEIVGEGTKILHTHTHTRAHTHTHTHTHTEAHFISLVSLRKTE